MPRPSSAGSTWRYPTSPSPTGTKRRSERGARSLTWTSGTRGVRRSTRPAGSTPANHAQPRSTSKKSWSSPSSTSLSRTVRPSSSGRSSPSWLWKEPQPGAHPRRAGNPRHGGVRLLGGGRRERSRPARGGRFRPLGARRRARPDRSRSRRGPRAGCRPRARARRAAPAPSSGRWPCRSKSSTPS